MPLIRGSQVSGSSISGGNFTTTSSFNTFTSSYYQDSSSFDHKINAYTSTSSFNTFTSSYNNDSGSFNNRITALSSSLTTLTGSYVTTGSFGSFTSSYFSDSASFLVRFSSSVSSSYSTNAGFYNAAHFSIGSVGDQTSALNTAFSNAGVGGIIFDYNSPTNISISGSVNANGKILVFRDGNMIIGSGSISNGIYDAGYRSNIFATSVNHTSSKVHSDKVSVMWFGAKGDQSQDDQPALQKASDTLIANTTLPRTLYVPGGGNGYSIHSPWILYNWNGTAYNQFSINIEGESHVNGSTLSGFSRIMPIGLTSSFAIGVQRASGGGISNLSIEGPWTTNVTNAQWYTGSWSSYPNIPRDSQYSPNAGIVIDPFGFQAQPDGGYPGFNSGSAINWYRGPAVTSGTTWFDISKMNISGFTIGIMNSPNQSTQQGEDCIIEDCQINFCKVAVAYGQAQSDRTTLRNLRCWSYIDTIVDSVSYGVLQGQIAFIDGINAAGNGSKRLFNIGAPKSTKITRVYSENLWSIGNITGLFGGVLVESSTFDFYLDPSAPGLQAEQQFNFRLCDISNCRMRYFDDQFNKRLRGVVDQVRFENTSFDAPPYLQYKHQSTHPNVKFQDCHVGTSSMLGMNSDIGWLSTYSFNFIPYGDFSLVDYSDDIGGFLPQDVPSFSTVTYKYSNSTFDRFIPLSTTAIITPDSNRSSSFTCSSAATNNQLGVNDLIIERSTGNYLGRVCGFSGSNVIISEIPSTISGSYTADLASNYFLTVGPSNYVGDITNASNIITNISLMNGQYPAINSKLDNICFANGTYVQSVNITGSNISISVSTNSTKTATRQTFANGNPQVIVKSLFPPSSFSTYTNAFGSNTVWYELVNASSQSPSVAATWYFNKGGVINAATLGLSASYQADYYMEADTRINSGSLEFFLPYQNAWTGSTGTYASTSSFNNLSSSYSSDSGSFNTRINNVFSSESNYVLTSSLIGFNLITASFTSFSSSYVGDSSSFNVRINAVPSTGGLLQISSFNIYTASANTQILNVYASESNYLLTSSFNTIINGINLATASLTAFSSSYVVDSSSFNSRINTTNTTASTLSSSYSADSASFNTRIASITGSTPINTGSLLLTSSFNIYTASTAIQLINIYASESNYLATSSFVNVGTISGSGTANYQVLFQGGTSVTNSMVYQSGSGTGSATLVGGNTTGSAGAILQIYGNAYLSASIYDSTNSTGSLNFGLVSGPSGILWVPTSSGGGNINTGSFLLTSSFNAYTSSKSSVLTAGTGLSGSTFNETSPVTFTANISTGVSGGQTAIGGTGSAESLTLESTAHPTKGKIYFGINQTSYFDENNNFLKIFNTNISGSSLTSSIYIQNSVTASVNNQQKSGMLIFESQGYKTTAPSGSQTSSILLYNQPVSNTTNPDTYLHIDSMVSSSAAVNIITLGLSAAVTPIMNFNGAFQIANANGIHFQAGSGNRTLLPQTSVQITGGTLSIGSTLTATTTWMNVAASTTTKAHINLSSGSNLTTPNDGDIWYTGSGDLYFQAKGVTYRLTTLGSVSGSVPAMTFIGSGSVSSSATCDINLSSSFNLYSSIQIDFMNVIPQTSGTSLLLRVSSDGINYDTGSTAYNWFWGNKAGFTASTGSDSKGTLVAGGGLLNGAGQGTDGTLKLYHPNQSTTQPQIRGDMILPGTVVADIDFAINRAANQFTKGIRFLCGSGNISMIWKAYGYN